MKYNIPAYIQKVLYALNAAGYEAYIAGGAVRDLLLGIAPGDFDITTSARPNNVLAICQKYGWYTVDKLGNNFGCVVALIDGTAVEITTFRGEAYGSDAHRPDKIWYCDTLKEDCSRRDFTVNAMAMDIDGNIYDYFGGQQDLAAKILRPVGNARQRYEEDALRMLRACRFVGQLGFTYMQDDDVLPPFGEEDTPYYLKQNYRFPIERCAGLSLERVRRELDKLLTSTHAGRGLMLLMATGLTDAHCRVKADGVYKEIAILPELRHLAGLHQNRRFHCYDAWEHTLTAVDNGPCTLSIRWALLLHDVGKGLPDIRKLNTEGQPTDPGHEAKSAVMTQEILSRLEYPKEFIQRVVWLVAQHMRFAPMLFTGESTLLRWVRGEATSGKFRSESQMAEAYTELVEVFLADMGATHARNNARLMADGKLLGEQVVELAKTKMPVAVSDLHIGGRDLLPVMQRSEIKNMLAYLLSRVQSGNLPNDKAVLMAAARKYLTKTGALTTTDAQV